jgi:type I restriction enzyme M protein
VVKYIKSFSTRARDIFEKFGFEEHIAKLDGANRLFLIVKKFAALDLHPSTVSNEQMGYLFEYLIRKFNEDANETAGDHFTPREVIQLMVNLLLEPDTNVLTQAGVIVTICDPACGTGGFLLAAHDSVAAHAPLDADQKRFLKLETLHGVELVDGVSRLCAMNLLLHGIGPTGEEGEPPVRTADSLAAKPDGHFDLVLTNPPFGKKSSVLTINEEGEQEREALTVVREDFWASTSNKQLNFVQHIKSLLNIPGRAAVVVPDNVLFEGGAGETVRRKLLHECEVHTLLRLPTGIFYAQGVKANVLFFDRKPASATPWTKELWIYDLRTNKNFTLKTNPLRRDDLDEFVACFHPANRHDRRQTWSEENPAGRWRRYGYDELIARDKASLDIFWLRDDSLEDGANLPEPDVLAAEIVEDLRAALEEFELIYADLERIGASR